MERVIALILAGGCGKRMGVLCYSRPKPALPFAGRYRVIDFTLSNCIRSKIDHMAVLVDYRRSVMAHYLEQWRSIHAASRKFRILQPNGCSYLGTADAVFQNSDFLVSSQHENVLVLPGDHIYHMDYRRMLDYHITKKADLTLCVARVNLSQASRFGIASVNAEGQIEYFVEKPETPQSNLASMGIYIFKKDVLLKRLLEDANKTTSLHDFGYSIIPSMVRRDRVFACEFNGYWQDIGTVEAFYQANMDLVSSQPPFNTGVALTVHKKKQFYLTPHSNETGNIQNSIVSPGCTVKGMVKNCILSPGVFIAENTFIRNSVLMDNVFVDRHSLVDACVVDEDVSIGRFCRVGGGPRFISGNGSVFVLGRGVRIPACATIGPNCFIPRATGSPAPPAGHLFRGSDLVTVSAEEITESPLGK